MNYKVLAISFWLLANTLKNQVSLIPDLLIGKLGNELYGPNAFYGRHEIVQKFIGHHIALQQPQKVEVPEFGQQVFSVELIMV